ncbi:hypothetical protein GCM10027414_14400 [Humibacter ginsengiterrae]
MTRAESVVSAEPLDEHVAPRTTLGESPRWAAGRWWWLDADDGRVWSSADLGTPPDLLVAARRRISLVQPAGPDLAVVADGDTIRSLRRTGTGWELDDARPLGLGPGWLLNDGCSDSLGRLWVGAVPPDGEHLSGVLLRMEGREPVVVHDDIAVSNGMAWSADGETLFHVDTGRAQLLAHHVDARRSSILATEVMWRFDDGLPDGVAVDAHGGIWVAVYGAGQVRRIMHGAVDVIVEVSTQQVTSVALGGADGCDILITTAREGFSAVDSRQDPAAGRVFRARSPYPALKSALIRRSTWMN